MTVFVTIVCMLAVFALGFFIGHDCGFDRAWNAEHLPEVEKK